MPSGLGVARQLSLLLDRPVQGPARHGLTSVSVPALDLFAGAGGLSIGMHAAGIEPLAAIEVVADAARTYATFHNVEVTQRDLASLEADEIRAFRGLVRVVVGGPPCQPWSTGGGRRGHADSRDGFPEFLRALRLIRPEAFVCENVAGLSSSAARRHFDELLRVLRVDLHYDVQHRVLDAADFGVPQHRRRMFIVGTREAGTFDWPTPSHGPNAESRWRRAGDVLSAEPVGEPNPSIVTFAKRPQLRPSPYDGLLFNGGGRPIDLTTPSRTILASAGGNKTPFYDTLAVVPGYHQHLREGGAARHGRVPGARRLTVAECAALQSFPAGMTFSGTRSSQYTQIGNAVPPGLAEAVGRSLLRALS